jgi:hypothetical protein
MPAVELTAAEHPVVAHVAALYAVTDGAVTVTFDETVNVIVPVGRVYVVVIGVLL